jgi:hypothetical protein
VMAFAQAVVVVHECRSAVGPGDAVVDLTSMGRYPAPGCLAGRVSGARTPPGRRWAGSGLGRGFAVRFAPATFAVAVLVATTYGVIVWGW